MLPQGQWGKYRERVEGNGLLITDEYTEMQDRCRVVCVSMTLRLTAAIDVPTLRICRGVEAYIIVPEPQNNKVNLC